MASVAVVQEQEPAAAELTPEDNLRICFEALVKINIRKFDPNLVSGVRALGPSDVELKQILTDLVDFYIKEPFVDSFIDAPFPKYTLIRPDEFDIVPDMCVKDIFAKQFANNANAGPPLHFQNIKILNTLIRAYLLKEDEMFDFEKVKSIFKGRSEIKIIKNNPKIVRRVEVGQKYKSFLFLRYYLPDWRDQEHNAIHKTLTHHKKEFCFDVALRDDGRLYFVYHKISELEAHCHVVKIAHILHENGIPMEVHDLRIQIISRMSRGFIGFFPQIDNKDFSNMGGSDFAGLLKGVTEPKKDEKILMVTPHDRSNMFYVLTQGGSLFIGGIASVPVIEEMYRTFSNLMYFELHPNFQKTGIVLTFDTTAPEENEKEVEAKLTLAPPAPTTPDKKKDIKENKTPGKEKVKRPKPRKDI